MSLPDDEVIDLLRDQFVVGWRNIHKDEHVGLSHGYRDNQTAVGTTNGAGGRNVQLIVMAADETVLHVLPGFWHPEDLVTELQFAQALNRLWLDKDRDRSEKERLFALLHESHVRRFSDDTVARSDWQSFDRAFEMQRAQSEPRDTIRRDETGARVLRAAGAFELKPVCVLVHDRMVQRPFVQYDAFDLEDFVDYGRPYYDNNEWIDDGRSFPAAERANEKREKEKAKAEAEARKAAEAEARKARRPRG